MTMRRDYRRMRVSAAEGAARGYPAFQARSRQQPPLAKRRGPGCTAGVQAGYQGLELINLSIRERRRSGL